MKHKLRNFLFSVQFVFNLLALDLSLFGLAFAICIEYQVLCSGLEFSPILLLWAWDSIDFVEHFCTNFAK